MTAGWTEVLVLVSSGARRVIPVINIPHLISVMCLWASPPCLFLFVCGPTSDEKCSQGHESVSSFCSWVIQLVDEQVGHSFCRVRSPGFLVLLLWHTCHLQPDELSQPVRCVCVLPTQKMVRRATDPSRFETSSSFLLSDSCWHIGFNGVLVNVLYTAAGCSIQHGNSGLCGGKDLWSICK